MVLLNRGGTGVEGHTGSDDHKVQSKGGEEHLDQPAGAGPRLSGFTVLYRLLLERDQLVACCGNLGVHILSMSFTVQLRCAKFLLII